MNECLVTAQDKENKTKRTRGEQIGGAAQRDSSLKPTKARKRSVTPPPSGGGFGLDSPAIERPPAPTKKAPRKKRASSLNGEAAQGRATQDKAALPKRHNIELGQRGEAAAVRFLDRRGYEIVERNWTCIAGEADIIARDEDALVFVEVKTRSSVDKGFPAEAVGAEKRRRYERIAALFLQSYDVVDVPVRFDVVSIIVVAPDRALIRHHINAFAAG